MTPGELQAHYSGLFEETGDYNAAVRAWKDAVTLHWPSIYRKLEAAEKMVEAWKSLDRDWRDKLEAALAEWERT